MKKSILIFLTILFSISFISAYYYSYGSFSIGNFIESNWENIFLIGILLSSFALLNLGLLKGLKDRTTSAIISFVVALFITAGVHFSGINLEGLFNNIGFSSDALYTLVPLIILGLLVLMGIIWGWGKSLLIVGLFLIASNFFVYSAGTIAIIGVILSIIGAIIWERFPKKPKKTNHRDGPYY
ncbi:MAG: hypothetical protein ABIA78_01575 [archaeon]